MKMLMTGILLVGAITAYAGNMPGQGPAQLATPLIHEIKTSDADFINIFHCERERPLVVIYNEVDDPYTGRVFYFFSRNECRQVDDCSAKLAGIEDKISIHVNRTTNEIIKFHLPKRCSSTER